MGSYSELIVRRDSTGPISNSEISLLAEKASSNKIGVFVASRDLLSTISTNCLVFDYDEFFFAVSHCPYLFASGLICVLAGDNYLKSTLLNNIRKLESLGYRCVMYCNENTLVMSAGKAIRECVDGYSISLDKF